MFGVGSEQKNRVTILQSQKKLSRFYAEMLEERRTQAEKDQEV